MAWDGYYEYAGQEFINVQRTETYMADVPWFRAVYNTDDLAPVLGDNPYRSPVLDDAPWTDPDKPDSYDFWGVFPLGVTGIEDSTRESSVVESLMDGGIPGRVRHKTRSMVFNVVLLGANDCANDYGIRWLKQLLLGSACGNTATQTCSGDDLCYLACEPCIPEGFVPTEAQDSETIDVDVSPDGDWIATGGTWNGTIYN